MTVLRDGDHALEHLAELQTPCVVLLDLHLPKVDGLEVLTMIRQDSRFPDVPVVLCTTSVTPETEARIRELGADYRVKPSDLNEDSKLAAYLLELCRTASAAP